MHKILFIVAAIAVLYGCDTRKQPQVVDTDLIAVVHTARCDTNEMSRWIAPYKTTLDRVMDVPIGYAPQTLQIGLPESSLGAMVTTAMGYYATTHKQHYDCIVTNIGGIRDSLAQGEITVGSIFRISPFNNRLVVLTISGSELRELCRIIAAQGGQVTSGIAMTIAKGSAENVKINKLPIDTLRNYKILTNDYLSFGNDYLYPLAKYTSIYAFEATLREVIVDYIRYKTRKGDRITAKPAGEVVVAYRDK